VLTALSIHDGPKVVLIDDLERGLHPKAVASFIQQLRGIQNPQLQIVATSHSPYLIDCMEADEVLLTSLDEDGYAVVRPLTDHPDYDRWKGLMSAGEFWSSVGEDWITREKKATA
jgi:predicted ATP-binding protein involved in virulence